MLYTVPNQDNRNGRYGYLDSAQCYSSESGTTLSGDNYGKRQGTLKNSEWRTARRMRFAIQCSPRRSPFAASYLFFPMFSIQGSLFNVHRSVVAAPFASTLAAHRAIRHWQRRFLFLFFFNFRYSMFAIHFRRTVRHSPFAIRRSPSHSPRHSLSLFNVPWRFP